MSELNKSLRIAKENSDKFEKQANELKKTLEMRTTNFLKEKADIKLQLEEALANLKKVDSNSSGLGTQNVQLRS